MVITCGHVCLCARLLMMNLASEAAPTRLHRQAHPPWEPRRALVTARVSLDGPCHSAPPTFPECLHNK